MSDAMPHFPAVQIDTGLPSDAVPEFIKQISSAIRKSETLQQSEIVESVQELAYGDFRVASWCAQGREVKRSLWVDAFPLIWSRFSREEQTELTHSIVKFLSLDMHTKLGSSLHSRWEELDKDYKQWGVSLPLPFCQQATSRYGSLDATSGVQVLLDSFIRCEPLPHIPPVLLLYLTKHYVGGSQPSILLEKMIAECEDPREKQVYLRCLYEIYRSLNEKDACAAMVKSMEIPELHNGAVLQSFGNFQVAQVAYLEGLRNERVINNSEALWIMEDCWKECALRLCQWRVLLEYIKLNVRSNLTLYCFEKANLWRCVLLSSDSRLAMCSRCFAERRRSR